MVESSIEVVVGDEQARQILFDMKFLGCRQSKVRSRLDLSGSSGLDPCPSVGEAGELRF